MRILLIGNVLFTYHMLRQLISMSAQVVGVCTACSPGLNSDYCDLAPLSEQFSIPLMRHDDINAPEVLDWVRLRRPDVIMCFGWSRLISNNMLKIPPLGIIGYHPAELPLNRGRHPIIWALALGLKKTASTFFFMDENADSGDIISQTHIEINNSDDATTLYSKITATARQQIQEIVRELSSGSINQWPQNSNQANNWRKRTAADGRIDWRMTADSIHNLVRALAKPYPGAEIIYSGNSIRLWKTRVLINSAKNIEPGKIIMYDQNRPVVRCGNNAIVLLETEPYFAPTVGNYL